MSNNLGIQCCDICELQKQSDELTICDMCSCVFCTNCELDEDGTSICPECEEPL